MLKRVQLVFTVPIKNRKFGNMIEVYYSGEKDAKNNRALQGETTTIDTEDIPAEPTNKRHPLYEDIPENEYKDDQESPTVTSSKDWSAMEVSSIELDSSSKKINIIMAPLKTNIASTTLKIRSTNWHTFTSSSENLEYLQVDEMEIPDVNIFAGPGEDAIEAIARAASIILVYIMWVCLIISPKHGISIIKVFQMADYLLYFNADTPTNLAAALIIFSATPLDYIPNPFDYFEATRGGTCSPPKKFEQNGVSCYILANIGGYVLQLTSMFILKVVSGILIKLSYRDLGEHSKIRKLSVFTHTTFNWEFIAGFLDGTQLDVYMSVYINYMVFKGDSLYSVVNLVICSSMGVGYLWMVITSLY
jgi:hypothetical protein